MPGNQIPEDVRARFDRLLKKSGMGGLGRLATKSAFDAIAPLIIEWTRKDQAEVDAQIAEKYWPANVAHAHDIAKVIRAQFAGETGGQ